MERKLEMPNKILEKKRVHPTWGAFGIRPDIIFLEVDERSERLRHNVFDNDPVLIQVRRPKRAICKPQVFLAFTGT